MAVVWHEADHGARHLAVQAHDVLGPAAQSLLAYVGSLPPDAVLPGASVQFGWVVFDVVDGPGGWVTLDSPDLRGDALTERTSDVSLALLGLTELVGFAQRTGLTPGEVRYDHTVLAHRDALGSEDVYLERLEPTRPGDSGWYLGPNDDRAQPTADELVIRHVWQLLLELPRVFGALALPTGSLVVVRAGEIVSVADATNTELWRDPGAAGGDSASRG